MSSYEVLFVLVLFVGALLLHPAEAFQPTSISRRRHHDTSLNNPRRMAAFSSSLTKLDNMIIPLVDCDATTTAIDPILSMVTTTLVTAAAEVATTTTTTTTESPSDTEEILKTVAIALTLGGGLIPATFSANQQMISALSGRKGYNNGEPVPEDDPSNTFDPTAGKGVNPAFRQYVIDSGASGPSLPQQQWLFAADEIPLADIVAVLGRIPSTESIVDWRNLPSATRKGTSTTNPPMWLPRNAFKVLIRQAKFVGWPNDPKTGKPIGGEELKRAELPRISKSTAQIGDAALDAVFDSWAWGASIATPDKVENTLKLFKPTSTELDLDAFVAAAIRGRK